MIATKQLAEDLDAGRTTDLQKNHVQCGGKLSKNRFPFDSSRIVARRHFCLAIKLYAFLPISGNCGRLEDDDDSDTQCLLLAPRAINIRA
jgi:hypothetical protein